LTVDKAKSLQRLSTAIQIRTISYDDPKQFNGQPFIELHQHLAQSFPLVHQQAEKTVINDYSLVFKITGSDSALKPILLMAHMDVVPVDGNTLDQWQHDPFSGKLVDGKVWGRGTMDDKGGLMAIMEAVEMQLSQQKQPKRTVYLAFGHDEEIGGKQGAAKVAEYFAQQQIQFEFVLDEGGAITEGLMQGVEQPVALIGVAEKGFANIHLTVDSEGGHSSQPPAQTAVGVISQAINKLQQNPYPAALTFTKMTFDAIGHKASFGSRLAMANLWLTSSVVKSTLMAQPKLAASLHTTMAPTMVSGSSKSNILPTQATAVVNIRIFPGQTAAQIQSDMEQIIDDPRVKLHRSMVSNPSKVSPIDNQSFNLISQSVRDLDHNVLVAPYLVQGGTDSKYFYGLSDNVYRFAMFRLNKKTLNRFHGIDEQLSEQEYFEMIRFFAKILAH
jgi:carboxypeptidase PM20D1